MSERETIDAYYLMVHDELTQAFREGELDEFTFATLHAENWRAHRDKLVDLGFLSPRPDYLELSGREKSQP